MNAINAIQRQRSSLFRIVVVLGTASLWVIVAIWQFKLVRELSDVTQARSGADLQILMTQWHRDLYDELSAICIAMQVGPDSGAHDAWNDYLERYAQWKQGRASGESGDIGSMRSDLVTEIYEWQTSAAGEPQLLRLNPTKKTLDRVGVPAEMERLLRRLMQHSASVQSAMRAWESEKAAESGRARPLQGNALAGWQLDDRALAIVHPVVHHADPFNSQTPVDRARVDWLVVALDLDVLRNQILPELAHRYFAGAGGLEYKVAVVDTDENPRVIYSSDEHLKLEDVAHYDSIMNIFSSSSTVRNSEFWQRLKESRNLQVQDWRSFSAPGWFPVFEYGTTDEPWALVLQHRTQPVTEVARSLRRRNVLTGGIVLLLLAANIVLILYASHRAEKLAKAQMEFVESTSHELLTPLSAIYCSGQNAKDGLLRTEEDMAVHGAIVTSQARQLIDLVKQNLSFAASGKAAGQFVLCPLQVSEILQKVRQNMAMESADSGCEVQYEMPAELPSVMGNIPGLAQCLGNLIGNAIKYSGRNGHVRVTASTYEGKSDSREVRISVQDDGPGIEDSELRHIFEPFYRSPSAVRAQIHGTGLGLTVAARVAEAMGGKLSVTSEVGVGSTFTLHLPAVQASAEVPSDERFTKAGVRQ
jgi:signal transduction histidine kinase